MRKWRPSRSFLEWVKSYAEWKNYSYAAHKGKVPHQKVYLSAQESVMGVSESIDTGDRNFSSVGLAK